jgi:hypothetical protein
MNECEFEDASFCESAYGGQGPNELPRDVSPGTCQHNKKKMIISL